jgi:hypothetical protein
MKQQNVFRSASFEAGVTGAAAKALIASLIVIMVCGITGIGNATEATPSRVRCRGSIEGFIYLLMVSPK